MNLNVKIIPRNKKLYIEYYEDKRRYKKSTKLDDTKANREFIKREMIPRIMKKLLDNKKIDIFDKDDDEKNLSFFLDKAEKQASTKKEATKKFYKVYINKLKEYFKNRQITKINQEEIDKYISTIEKKYKKCSIRAIIVPLQLAFKIAYKEGVISKIPSFEINKANDKEDKESLSKEQIKILLDNAEGILKDYLMIAFYTGLRISEILGLKWSDVNYEKNYISIERIYKFGLEQLPKNNKSWICPLNPILKEYLHSIYKNKNSFIIPRTDSKINYDFKELQKKLNFEKTYSSHTIRHTFISQCVMAGLSPHYIKLFTGHKTTDMINKVYTHYLPNLEEIEKYNTHIKII